MLNRFILILVFALIANATWSSEFSSKALHYPSVVESFYKSRDFQNVWTDAQLIQQLEQTIMEAPLHGLRAEDYHFNAFARGTEHLFSDAFISYAHDLRFGRASHRLKGEDWKFTHNDLELVPVLEEAISTGQVRKQLTDLAPSFSAYRLLQDALIQYRQLADSGGWSEVQDPIDLNEQRDPVLMDELRRRLAMTNDLVPNRDLMEAVLRFQQRHGLREDGIVGKETIAALTLPAAERVAQIELSLERLRWMPREMPERFVIVNVPGFNLRMYERNESIGTIRVIVGKTTWCTPTFLSSEINQIILNPFWYVPAIIAEKEIYPLLEKDPTYLQRNNIRIIPRSQGGIQLRQSPGPGNSLGRIKFLFPNCCDCYLHDTPDKGLFEKVLRLFSHGCIRIERALDLANWILEQEGWSAEKLVAEIESNKTQTIRLTRPFPIFIVYFTAWVDQDGFVQFRNDVYGKDKQLKRSLGR